jgi:ornithine--oxo-acid transaminase
MITAAGMSSEPQYRDGFGPFPAGFIQIPFGDIAAPGGRRTDRSAAFLSS